jgi:hypothetical protein
MVKITLILGGVICRFLDGLQKNYDLPATDNFHSVFRTDGTHSYFQGEERFEALERALETERRFDAAFFDKILEKFVAAGKKEEESS